MTVAKKRALKISLLLGFFIILGLIIYMLLSGENADLIKSVFTEDLTRDEIRDRLIDVGIRGYLTIAILAMLQVVLTFLPAEPVQVIGGIAFGFVRGVIACIAGVIVGNTIIFILYKIYGTRLNNFFDKNLELDLNKANHSGKLAAVVFLLYFLPAIPYGMICFFAASTRMKYPRYITLTVLGAIPSVCIGVGLGDLALSTGWIVTGIILFVVVTLLIIMMVKKDAIMAWINKIIRKLSEPHSTKTVVRKYSSVRLYILAAIARTVFFFKGIRVRLYNKAGQLSRPSIVLCNHGSFFDFAYSGLLIKKYAPNYIVARLYYCNRTLARVLRAHGTFPKSMFTMDLESAKNCRRVLRSGGVLAFMPEARLSTVGKFEDIQPSTYAFLKQAGVDVYTVKINGDYLCDPKWGHGLRRGSLVEATLEQLISADELPTLTTEEIATRVEERLSYNELEWLDSHPEVHYKSKRLAEGLENVLAICPRCGARHALRTRRRTVSCEKCDMTLEMNDRYAFVGDAPFRNFAEWYDWQYAKLSDEILNDPTYTLTDRVTLKLPSTDGKKQLRVAGEGECTLSRDGLVYKGTMDGETVELCFSMNEMYRLLFGAGVNFEIYRAQTIYFFVPTELRSAVTWYMASKILKDSSVQ